MKRTSLFVLVVALLMAVAIVLLSLSRVEVRAAPEAVCHWTGPADGVPRDWSSIAYWDCGEIPGPGDTAVISGYGRVVDVDSPLTVQNLFLLESSTLNGFHTITVTGNMEWDGEIAGGAHLSPTGAVETLVIAPGAILSIAQGGNPSRLYQGRLVNYGTVEHAAGHTLKLLYAVIDNRPGGTYHASSGSIDKNNLYPTPDDGGFFNNAGRLVKDGDGLFTLHAALSNTGLVAVLSDTLKVEIAAHTQVVTHTGSFSITASGTLLLSGHEHRFEPPSSISGQGVFRLDSANATVRGAYDLTGLTDLWFAADLDLETPDGVVNLPTVHMGNSTRLRGSNDITITQALTMSESNAIVEGSTAAGNTLNIAPGARMWVMNGGGVSARTLNNYGAIELVSSGCFVMRNDAVFNNYPTGIFAVTTGSIEACEPWPPSRNGVVNNYGQIVKLNPGDFTIDAHISLNNTGTIEVGDGTLRADGPFRQMAGETFLNSSTLRNGAHDLVFDGGKLRGSGTIDLFQNKRLENNGAILQPVGLLALNEDYVQGVSGTLQIDIGGLTPGAGYGVFEVMGDVTLSGRLALTPTNNFLPASGDIFRVMGYGTRNGVFAQVTRGLGLAFGPEYQSDGVVVSDNPTLVEFSQRPDRRTMLPASNSGFSLRLTNSHTETVGVTFRDTLPAGFVFIDGSATSNVPLAPPTVTPTNGAQTLSWPTLDITPGTVVTIHFGVLVTQTVGAYTNTAEVVVTPTVRPPRTIRLYEQVDVSLSPTSDTVIEVTSGISYPPTEPDGLWTISIRQGTPPAEIGVTITSTPVCVLPQCGPLKRFYALHDGQIFPLTLVNGTTDRYRGEIPLGQFNLYERIFLVPVFYPPGGVQADHLSVLMTAGQCEHVGGLGSTYQVFDPLEGVSPCRPVTNETTAYIYDPSGHVTDAQKGTPIQGATVTLYRVAGAWPDTRTATQDCHTVETRPGGVPGSWDSLAPATSDLGWMEDPLFTPAAIDPAINPQTTDTDGYYGWDVVRGCWYVKVEAPGYFARYSPLVGVPPEVTDLDIALEPLHRVYLPMVIR